MAFLIPVAYGCWGAAAAVGVFDALWITGASIGVARAAAGYFDKGEDVTPTAEPNHAPGASEDDKEAVKKLEALSRADTDELNKAVLDKQIAEQKLKSALKEAEEKEIVGKKREADLKRKAALELEEQVKSARIKEERLEEERKQTEWKLKLLRKEIEEKEVDRTQFPIPNWLARHYGKGKINIAVTGMAGVGKSSFINFLGLQRAGKEFDAITGASETTMYATKYDFNLQESWWDLPGVGTKNFPQATYLRNQGIRYFDLVFLITADRFTEGEFAIKKECDAHRVPTICIRNKIDVSIDAKITEELNKARRRGVHDLSDDVKDKLAKQRMQAVRAWFASEYAGLEIFLLSANNRSRTHVYDLDVMQKRITEKLVVARQNQRCPICQEKYTNFGGLAGHERISAKCDHAWCKKCWYERHSDQNGCCPIAACKKDANWLEVKRNLQMEDRFIPVYQAILIGIFIANVLCMFWNFFMNGTSAMSLLFNFASYVAVYCLPHTAIRYLLATWERCEKPRWHSILPLTCLIVLCAVLQVWATVDNFSICGWLMHSTSVYGVVLQFVLVLLIDCALIFAFTFPSHLYVIKLSALIALGLKKYIDPIINRLCSELAGLNFRHLGIGLAAMVAVWIWQLPICLPTWIPGVCSWTFFSTRCDPVFDHKNPVFILFVFIGHHYVHLGLTIIAVAHWSKIDSSRCITKLADWVLGFFGLRHVGSGSDQLMTQSTAAYAAVTAWFAFMRYHFELSVGLFVVASIHNVFEWWILILLCWGDSQRQRQLMFGVFVFFPASVLLVVFIAPANITSAYVQTLGLAADCALMLQFVNLKFGTEAVSDGTRVLDWNLPLVASLSHVFGTILPILWTAWMAGDATWFTFGNELTLYVSSTLTHLILYHWSTEFDSIAPRSKWVRGGTQRFCKYMIAGFFVGLVPLVGVTLVLRSDCPEPVRSLRRM